MKCPEIVKVAVAGKGVGMGGSIQGDGGVVKCECPECGSTISHPRGTPCTSIKCPKCGAKMVGKE